MTRAAKSLPVGTNAPGRASIPDRTLRTDPWWRAPLVTFVLLSAWVLYALLRTASQRAFFASPEHYLSPFSSPCITTSCPPAARDFGTWFGDFPPFIAEDTPMIFVARAIAIRAAAGGLEQVGVVDVTEPVGRYGTIRAFSRLANPRHRTNLANERILSIGGQQLVFEPLLLLRSQH